MTKTDMRISGLTLVEVLIALSLLSIGILAIAHMQLTGFTATRASTDIQQLTNAARSELELWRPVLPSAAYSEPTQDYCRTIWEPCSVEIRPCVIINEVLDCNQEPVIQPVAHAITVTIGTNDRSTNLHSIVAVEQADAN